MSSRILGSTIFTGMHLGDSRLSTNASWMSCPGRDADSIRPDENGNLPIDGALLITPAEFRAGTKTERRGDMNSSGEVSFVNVIRLKFVSAKLQLEGNRFGKISFVTEPVDGTCYSFDGEFLAEPRLEKGSYVELAGNLRKLKNGRKVAEANLKFLRWVTTPFTSAAAHVYLKAPHQFRPKARLYSRSKRF
jgi:hypothetical protein